MTLTLERQKVDQFCAIQLRALDHDFGGRPILTGVSFAVEQGSITAMVGPNGAGKSTVMNCIAGSLRNRAGTIEYLGDDVTSMPISRRSRAGLVRTFQLPSDFGRLTVLENLLVGAEEIERDSLLSAFLTPLRRHRVGERAAVQRARDLLRRYHLQDKEHHYAADLSGGQRRLVEFLRALMMAPKVLLLDEPFAGIHPENISRMGDHLQELRDEGMTILLIAHELDVVDRYCDSVVVLARGTVLFEGTMAEARVDQRVVDAYVAG